MILLGVWAVYRCYRRIKYIREVLHNRRGGGDDCGGGESVYIALAKLLGTHRTRRTRSEEAGELLLLVECVRCVSRVCSFDISERNTDWCVYKIVFLKS